MNESILEDNIIYQRVGFCMKFSNVRFAHMPETKVAQTVLFGEIAPEPEA